MELNNYKMEEVEDMEQKILNSNFYNAKQDIDVFFFERNKKQFVDVWGYKEEDSLLLANDMAVQYKQDILNKTKPLKDTNKELDRLANMDKFVVQKAVTLLGRFCKLSTQHHTGK